MLQEKTTNEVVLRLVFLSFLFGMNYIKYIFLTGTVLFSFAVLMIAIIMSNPDFSFAFMKYFSFVNPIFANESYHFGIKEIMQVFSVVSLFFMMVGAIIKAAIKKFFSFNISFSHKRRLLFAFLAITALYVMTSFIVFKKIEPSEYLVFIFFYFFNMASLLLYFLFGFLSEKISLLPNSKGL